MTEEGDKKKVAHGMGHRNGKKSGTLLVEGDIGVQGPPNTLDRLKAGLRDPDKSSRDKIRRRWQRSLLAFSRFG